MEGAPQGCREAWAPSAASVARHGTATPNLPQAESAMLHPVPKACCLVAHHLACLPVAELLGGSERDHFGQQKPREEKPCWRNKNGISWSDVSDSPFLQPALPAAQRVASALT